MQRKYIIFGFGILLASVISVIAVSYRLIETDPQDQNTLINNEIIPPYKSVSAVKLVKAGENMQLLVHYPVFGALLNAKVTDPRSIVSNVNSTTYDRELSSTFTAQVDGEYTVTITNLGTEQIPVHVVFSNVQR